MSTASTSTAIANIPDQRCQLCSDLYFLIADGNYVL